MNFKSKLSIAFSCVLSLTIVVAATDWLGMERSTSYLEKLYVSTHEIESSFYKMLYLERSYQLTRDMMYSRGVNNHLERIDRQLRALPHQDRKYTSEKNIANVLLALERYKESFALFNSSVLAQLTMKSRMQKESKRLVASINELMVSARSEAQEVLFFSANISKLLNHILLLEKEYALSGRSSSIRQISDSLMGIQQAGEIFQDSRANESDQLKVFRILQATKLYSAALEKLLAEEKGAVRATEAMKSAQLFFSDSLSKYLAQQREGVKKKVRNLRYISFIITLLAIIVGGVAVISLSALITRPVNALKKSAQDIVDGKLDTHVQVTSNDDIGELAVLFNKMTEKLRDSFQRIDEYKNHLEEQVITRTANLKKEVEQHQQTAEDLRTSSQQLENIINQSPLGIIIFDEKFTIVEWNPSCERIFGYNKAEIKGMPWDIIVPKEAQEEVTAVIQSMKIGDSIRKRNNNITKSKVTITCDWYNTPLTDSGGKVGGMLCLVEDVTNRISMENELLKVKKLESTGVLAGGIAHDFNNILTAILGNLNLALVDTSLRDRTKALIVSAEKASERAKSLTQQLLTFSKGGDPIKEQTSISEVIRDSAEFIVHGTPVSCRFEFPADLWMIEADKGQISQVIQNIALNSIQAMPGGGILSIACCNISGEEVEDDFLMSGQDYVEVCIKDTGSGIPQEIIDNIFDPYFSTKNEGSGLGLAITHSIIEKHNGHIAVSSSIEQGTSFTIHLPANRELQLEEAHPEPPSIDDHEAVILIMDDDQMVLNVAEAILEEFNHQVITVVDGDECIRKYTDMYNEGNPPDLLILDLIIPGGKGGVETIKELLEINPDIKAIVASGYSNDPAISSHKELGFYKAISKPYKITEFMKIIESALDDT